MQVFRTAEELMRKVSAGRSIIYGAGWAGQIVCEFLQNEGGGVEAFAETGIKEKRTLRKVPVLSLDDALNKNPSSKNLESKKFVLFKKPMNPSRFQTHPAAPELFALCVIPAVFLKGRKNISANNA